MKDRQDKSHPYAISAPAACIGDAVLKPKAGALRSTKATSELVERQ